MLFNQCSLLISMTSPPTTDNEKQDGWLWWWRCNGYHIVISNLLTVETYVHLHSSRCKPHHTPCFTQYSWSHLAVNSVRKVPKQPAFSLLLSPCKPSLYYSSWLYQRWIRSKTARKKSQIGCIGTKVERSSQVNSAVEIIGKTYTREREEFTRC